MTGDRHGYDVERVEGVVEAWQGARILVAGDMMMDEYVYGTTDRVSREAPVIIVRYDGSEWSLGGAANAARNVASMGGRAEAFGFAGKDERGLKMKALMKDAGIVISGMSFSARRTTVSKTRILAGDYHAQRQQIARIDREERSAPGETGERTLLERLSGRMDRAGAIILSDYGQGTLSRRMIRSVTVLAGRKGIPVIADSRFRLRDFRGVTTATPNEVEAAEAAGTGTGVPDGLEETGRRLLAAISSESLLITRGRYGMALFRRGRRTMLEDVVGSPEATDVTGAGDTVVSAVALSLAAGADMVTAMRIANLAASVVVMKRGTAVASTAEIVSAARSASGAGGS